MSEFQHVTTELVVGTHDSAVGVFSALLREVRELSKKKPDATLSGNKVKIINNVLNDLISFLQKEPEGKYLQILEDDELPQFSDALMVMVQFDAALDSFKERYYRYVNGELFSGGNHYWITEERLAAWDATGAEPYDEDSEGDI